MTTESMQREFEETIGAAVADPMGVNTQQYQQQSNAAQSVSTEGPSQTPSMPPGSMDATGPVYRNQQSANNSQWWSNNYWEHTGPGEDPWTRPDGDPWAGNRGGGGAAPLPYPPPPPPLPPQINQARASASSGAGWQSFTGTESGHQSVPVGDDGPLRAITTDFRDAGANSKASNYQSNSVDFLQSDKSRTRRA